ncbi:trehalase-like isoform X1 [Adelges cooleyi]|uniref:trehalase-like isoform X1 n=1 Tax=Adelges cooleyi TaxID=133065 RepID=UPI0021801C76|nr:trehalase-like isoform X1 [Adelges cooleyi]
MYPFTTGVSAVVLLFQVIQLTRSQQLYERPRPLQGAYNGPYEEICSSQIYCHGELLDDVQSTRLYPDSKTFVDMTMLRDEEDIVNDYKELKKSYGGVPDNQTLLAFVNKNFKTEELQKWLPPDLVDYPAIVEYIRDPAYRQLAVDVNQIWKLLARKIPDDVRESPKRHSHIYVPNGFFVAGGRFSELYYWDTYWIIRGALLCGMKDTVKGILENMLHLVKTYGYMLNGNRVYYLKRSQPPLLIKMVSVYWVFSRDIKFVYDHIKTLETEFNFWMSKRTIIVEKDGNRYIMAHYNTATKGPRPESYYEDKALAESLPDADKDELYTRLKSAAESGWDFSTKHFNDNGRNTGTLMNTDPQNFIYVELNSILQGNARILSELFLLTKNYAKATKYAALAQRFQIGIDALLWNEAAGIWMDYDISTQTHRNYFYPTNLTPLWTGSYNKRLTRDYGELAVNYLLKNEIINANLEPNYLGVPTSLFNSTQQWDYPNCWPALEAIVIFGLDMTDSPRAKEVAYNLASAWVYTNYVGFKKTGYMFEKYSAIYLGESGNGGEYTAQTGFGWTNGLLFELLYKWGYKLKSE